MISDDSLGTIRVATQADVDYVADNMREDDVREVYAAAMLTPRKAVDISIERTDVPMVGEVDGVPFVLFGVSYPYALADYGMPWLLATPAIEAHAVPFLRHSAGVVREMKARYDHLENWVDARNRLSIRWLRWCGFTVDPATPFGALKRPFHRFHARA